MSAVRSYVFVTLAYWAFTLTDGALRMLVLLHFHQLGYTPVELAFLFLFYELAGVFTNLFGGWLASRTGLRVTLLGGLGLQIAALGALALVDASWSKSLSVAYVMASQSLSGVAKDLTKMSAKSTIKLVVPEGEGSALFRWVAVLTGSKNALKGVGFFLGGLLLTALGYRPALGAMGAALLVVLLATAVSLPAQLGKAKAKKGFDGLLSRSRGVNVLSAARFFLFGARDIWFVVGVPVFLAVTLGWSNTSVGSFLAAWVIGYGVVQSAAPLVLGRFTGGRAPQGTSATVLAFLLAAITAVVALGLAVDAPPSLVMIAGLGAFGVAFALGSSVHSYLILSYSDGDEVALNVGFYYMANAGGRLVGTVLSGALFQLAGVGGCLWGSVLFALAAGGIALALPKLEQVKTLAEVGGDAGGD